MSFVIPIFFLLHFCVDRFLINWLNMLFILKAKQKERKKVVQYFILAYTYRVFPGLK